MKIYASVFRMDQDYWFQFRFFVEEQASLEVVNSSIDDPKGFGLSCLGYSKINMNNSDLRGMETCADGRASVVISNSITDTLIPSGNCRMVVLNSSLSRIELDYTRRDDQESLGVIDGLRVGHIEYLKLQQNQTGIDLGCDLTLINTTVDNWSLDVDHKTKLALSNSALGILWIWYRQTDAEIYGLHPGYFEDFEVCNLTLRKTSIAEFWVWVFDSASVDLIDTKVSLHFWPGKCTASLSNSEVYSFMAWFSSGVLFFNKSSLACTGITNTQLYIVGDVTNIEWQGDWFSSNVTRNYTIIMKDTNNNSLEDVELTLSDQDNTALWNGFSDSLGTASFNITFADNNRTDALMLRTFKEGFYNFTSSISLLLNTPVSVVLTEKIPGDLDLDRRVSLADLVLLAQAYGCKPGDSNWNPNADIDTNGTVGLSDLVALALHYGQHYP